MHIENTITADDVACSSFPLSPLVPKLLERPGGLFNMEAKAKWDAYSKRKGLSKEEAMKSYIEKVDALCGTSFASKI